VLLARYRRRFLFVTRLPLIGIAAAFAGRRIGSGVAAVAVGANQAALGLGALGDGLFAAIELGGEGRLRGLLRDRRSRLRVTRYGC